ncbi:hypothetical protein [Roseofilum casamattae]|uniref:Uncharacterized protein n=1 Tax=Roseofilum casamattae BLCC-M143 TaxID=3022442 RepID=A0ABT7BSN3_9CYAN|nr:hypothetical protein [Roseofilum casamattae]MDJ1182206.1 hypothetical protein [Roseofilum casamattae BLCC-M143]
MNRRPVELSDRQTLGTSLWYCLTFAANWGSSAIADFVTTRRRSL